MNKIAIVGSVEINYYNALGKLLGHREGKNLFLSGGKAAIAELAVGSLVFTNLDFALGSGTTAPVEADTALDSEIVAIPRVAAVDSTLANIAVYTANTIVNNSGGVVTVSEVGLFHGAVLWSRFLVNAFTLSNGDSIDIQWGLEFG